MTTFLRYSSKVVIAKRHPKIVKIFCIFSVCYIGISRPISLIVITMITTKKIEENNIIRKNIKKSRNIRKIDASFKS